MRYRTLGKTGLRVSEIGFGAWGIGGGSAGAPSYGPTDDRESLAALARAFDLGITFFDTAGVYGDGRSEALIGRAFERVRDKVVIASKVGFLSFERPDVQEFSPSHLRAALDASLTRLRTDYLDLYQLHCPSIESIQREPSILDSLVALRRAGKIRSFGLSLRSPEDGLVALAHLGVPVVQVNLNMIDQRALESGLCDLAVKVGAGVIARTPLNFGFLSGKVTTMSFPAGDHRSRWPKAQIEKWLAAPWLFTALNEGTDRTLAELALQFCVTFDAVATVIPGMLTAAEVEENARAGRRVPLSRAEVYAIREIYRERRLFELERPGTRV